MTKVPINPYDTPSVEYEKRVGVPMELRCGQCNRAALYPVGRLCLDPTLVDPRKPESVDEAFGFSGYFHCQFCGAGGPWHLTRSSGMLLDALMREAVFDPDNARLIAARPVLFDGTISRWPTQGEAYLKSLIEKKPGEAFLWNRLGNLYKTADAYELAKEAYDETLKRDEHQIESMHSLGEMYENRGQDEESARWYQQVLLHARHAPAEVPAQVVRDLVRDSLTALVHLHHKSNRKIAMLPELPQEAADGPSARAIVEAYRNDTSKEESRERVIDVWVGSRAPRPRQAPVSRPTTSRPTPHPRRPAPTRAQIGRNDPCPCGSGKKYKVCCGRS
jgi:hypothetical protein